jgi:hypothetical protein
MESNVTVALLHAHPPSSQTVITESWMKKATRLAMQWHNDRFPGIEMTKLKVNYSFPSPRIV